MAKVKDKAQPKAKKAEGELSWKEIEIGSYITDPGSSTRFRTGDWKSRRPEVDLEKCNKCTLCYFYCPEGCIAKTEDGYFLADLYYCKGCGICAVECPKDAIGMVKEEK
jgi:pyruvate ferredoxin oxidoreductase delta subunit